MGDVPKFHFGDIVENGWASDENPTKRGIVVRQGKTPSGQINTGPWVEVTNGKGKFWRLIPTGDHKIKVVGHLSIDFDILTQREARHG